MPDDEAAPPNEPGTSSAGSGVAKLPKSAADPFPPNTMFSLFPKHREQALIEKAHLARKLEKDEGALNKLLEVGLLDEKQHFRLEVEVKLERLKQLQAEIANGTLQLDECNRKLAPQPEENEFMLPHMSVPPAVY